MDRYYYPNKCHLASFLLWRNFKHLVQTIVVFLFLFGARLAPFSSLFAFLNILDYLFKREGCNGRCFPSSCKFLYGMEWIAYWYTFIYLEMVKDLLQKSLISTLLYPIVLTTCLHGKLEWSTWIDSPL